jgi:hypothetical protein
MSNMASGGGSPDIGCFAQQNKHIVSSSSSFGSMQAGTEEGRVLGTADAVQPAI